MSGPSYSPENHYSVDGKEYTLGISNTCDIVLIREILTIAVQAEKKLGISESGSEFEEKLSKLPDYKIGKDGRIQEWFQDFAEPDPHHRHTSHLLGLYPFHQITPERTPELARAAEKSLKFRYENYEITSWGMAMYLGYMARMRNAVECENGIRTVFRELVKSSLIAVMGDETAMWQGTWELDGNTGMTSAMAELMIQSDGDDIYVLPALPSDWKTGRLTGMALHHARTVDVKWCEGKLSTLTIHPEKEGRAVIHLGKLSVETVLHAGEAVLLDGELHRLN